MTDLSKLMQNAALLDVIDKSADEASNLSAQNSYQAMRIEELEREIAALIAEREGNTRQFRRLQDRLAKEEADNKWWREENAALRQTLQLFYDYGYDRQVCEAAIDAARTP